MILDRPRLSGLLQIVMLRNEVRECRASGVFLRLSAQGLIAENDIHANGEAGLDIRKGANPIVVVMAAPCLEELLVSFHGSLPDVNVCIWSFCLSFKSATKFTVACARGSWFWATEKVLFEATGSITTKKRACTFSSAVILWSGGSTRSEGLDFIPRLVSGKFLFTAHVLSD